MSSNNNVRDNPLDWLDEALHSLHQQGLLRHLRTRSGAQQAAIELDGQRLINFAANDYLGLASDPRVADAATAAIADIGWGAGASPLITGHTDAHAQLESDLAAFEATEAALVFPSGFAANAGTIAALVDRNDAIFADAKNHASLIDGCRLSGATVHVYRHGDVLHLAELLADAPMARRRLIVTDSLFSMDGDLAPLAAIAELRDRHRCMLMIDEAHATGVFGEQGRGVAEQLGVEDAIDIKVGTLSKAIGCAGGFVCGSSQLVDWLINRARPYVFSTAHPAAGAAAASMAVRLVREEPFRRVRLLRRAAELRERLARRGWDVPSSASQIIPIRTGAASHAVALSAALAQRGTFVPAIRPPSVPDGESLLRLSLTYDHSEAEIDSLEQALEQARDQAV